ncbi:hypothetical protein [Pantoea sp. JKS000250]|uniref:hypothetical protein n=1 Tax=Pantoea sp. JKS000250 TaxID=1938795 RepID=UPI000D767D1F|nr:hypothetical protein [Pantoea sp. JKS000250]PXW19001.1 hypothetical protein BY447_0567 [Pantoea sp. JKS000250]
MQSWFFSWKYADESGTTAAGWDTFDIPSNETHSEITKKYIHDVSSKTGLDSKNIILVAFNKI